jgi:hypothetical protein
MTQPGITCLLNNVKEEESNEAGKYENLESWR